MPGLGESLRIRSIGRAAAFVIRAPFHPGPAAALCRTPVNFTLDRQDISMGIEAPTALSLIEKRSLVYARLPPDARGNILTVPGQLQPIPYATMVWIEHLLKKGQTEWPWFSAVLQFVGSAEYEQIKSSILAEIAHERARWDQIARRGKTVGFGASRSRVTTNFSTHAPAIHAPTTHAPRSWDPNKSPSRPYFWENLDTSWWREQP